MMIIMMTILTNYGKEKTIRDSVEQVKSAIIITAIEELEKEIKGLIDSTAPVQDPDLAEAKKIRRG